MRYAIRGRVRVCACDHRAGRSPIEIDLVVSDIDECEEEETPARIRGSRFREFSSSTRTSDVEGPGRGGRGRAHAHASHVNNFNNVVCKFKHCVLLTLLATSARESHTLACTWKYRPEVNLIFMSVRENKNGEQNQKARRKIASVKKFCGARRTRRRWRRRRRRSLYRGTTKCARRGCSQIYRRLFRLSRGTIP